MIEGIHAAADALYVLARHGAYSQLLRIPAGMTSIEEVPLPDGHVDVVISNCVINLSADKARVLRDNAKALYGLR